MKRILVESIIIHTKNKKQAKIFESLAEALGITFEKQDSLSPYNEHFVKRIRKSEKDFAEGRFTSVEKKGIDNFIDSL